jgi:hypothetical protein
VRDLEPNIRFGNDVAAAAVGHFTGDAVDELLALGRDGSLRLAFGMKRGTRTYTRVERVGEVPAADLPMSVARALSADINHDGRIDVLVPRSDGRLLVLLNRPGDGGRPRFDRSLALGAPSDATEIDVGTFGAPARQRLVWVDADGRLNAATIAFAGAGLQVGSPERLLDIGKGAHLAVGRFLGRADHDIIAGRQLLKGGDPASAVEIRALPTTADWKSDAWWRAGDIDGNGMDDLVRKRTLPASAGGPEVSIQFAARPGEAQQGFFDDDLDGLPDAWEEGAIRPGGLDLKALGCKPRRSDVIVELERFDNVDVPLLRTEVDVTVRYFASLPVANPDGTRGIAMHVIYRPPTPHAKFDEVSRHFFADEWYPPREHRGIVHTMFCGATGDVHFSEASLMSDHGKFVLGPPVHDVMSHEFGHELGLPHEAFQPHNSPIYMSLMSNAYIVGPGGRLDLTRYSEGRLSSLILNERHLSERVPFRFDQVRFLSWTPYMFPLKSAPGGVTLVDWNRNGVFGEEDTIADINYCEGTSPGALHELGRCDTAPALVTHGSPDTGRLLVLYGQAGTLKLRQWRGTNVDTDGDNWSPEVIVEPAGLRGDPTAVHVADATWVAYQTTDQAVLRGIWFSGDHPTIGPRITVAESRGAEPTLTSFAGELALFLWRGPNRPFGLRMARLRGRQPEFGREEESGFSSLVPVAAVEARERNEPDLCVGVTEPVGPDGRPRTIVGRFRRDSNGRWRRTQRELVAGNFCNNPSPQPFVDHAGFRMQLLWRPETGFASFGRLYHLTGGPLSDQIPWSEQFLSMQASALETGTGWFTRRYCQETGTTSSTRRYFQLTSRHAPGACWFRSDIAYGVCVHDDKPDRDSVLKLAFYGSGALPQPMSDFNDVAFIHRVGLSHSIYAVTPETEAATPNLPGPIPPKR